MMGLTSLALLNVALVGFVDAPKSPEATAFDAICRALEANAAAIRSYRVTMRIKSRQEPLPEFLRKKAPAKNGRAIEPRIQEVTVRCLGDSSARVRCECEIEQKAGQDAPQRRHPPFTAVFDGRSVRRLETRTGVRGTIGRLGKIVSESPRVFYQGINPREFVIDLEGHPAGPFLEEHHARMTGAAEWDSARVVVVETAAIPDGTVERMMRVLVNVEQNYTIVKAAACIRNRGAEEWTEYTIKESHDHQQSLSGVWLPRRAVYEMWAVPSGSDKPPRLLSRYDIQFIDFELDPVIPDSAFELAFPEKTLVQDDVTGRRYETTELTDQILADQIATANEERGLVPAPKRGRGRIIAVSVVSLVFLVGLLFLGSSGVFVGEFTVRVFRWPAW